MTTSLSEFAHAKMALAAFAVDPTGLKGLTVTARPGPVRQVFEALFTALPAPVRRIHPGLSDEQLYGGLDLAASLVTGRAMHSKGFADAPAIFVLPMAERTTANLAARLSQLVDAGRGHGLILLDEAAGDEPAPPGSLRDRLAFAVTLDGLRHDEACGAFPAPADLDAARSLLARIAVRPSDAACLTELALHFGISSLRAPLLALRACRTLAALAGRSSPTDEDIATAAELVYSSRATLIPTEHETAPAPEHAARDASGEADEPGNHLPDETLVAAIAARLPANILDRLAARAALRGPSSGSGAGARRRAKRRGRPLPARPGPPGDAARIDIVATLRRAAPWQTLRRIARPASAGPIIHPQDICLRRYEDRSDRLLIFAVDASGSAALARLAEAKGSVELLLAQAYARRDQVALIAFRGQGATLLLPPTRSLVQAKRRLAALPGGGATPLAAGLREALSLGQLSRMQGMTPALALLTDGRANIALDGTGDRTRASADALKIARCLAGTSMPGIVIDTSLRPSAETPALAAALGAHHVVLPHADSSRIARAVAASLSD